MEYLSQIAIPMAIALGFLIAAYIGFRIVNRIRAERRHDKAKRTADSHLNLLSTGVVSAESTVHRGNCRDSCHVDLGEARTTLRRLSELKDKYYEQGATPEEWLALAAEAERSAGKAHQALVQAADDQLWDKLARQAIEQAQTELAAVRPINDRDVDVSDAVEALTDAQRLLGQFQLKAARDRAYAIPTMLRWAEVAAHLESVESMLSAADGDNEHVAESRDLLIAAWHLATTQSDLESVRLLARNAEVSAQLALKESN